ncbi:NKAP family protein-like isoform X2 [Mytilus californianus]|uniref:NKAP family protein-like isoform X2 n=1 Tax=Mytilus californianus TaxID=6549 RepID=UPI00224657F3|nr:NKAP family protein-like isoform X2 [Mytilus californianus]
MEIVKDQETGDLYKNGEKYRRFNGVNVNEENVDTSVNASNSGNKGKFSFHAKGNDIPTSDILISSKSSDIPTSDVLISSRSNPQSPKQLDGEASDFKYYANGDIEYEVVSSQNSIKDTKSIRSQKSPDFEKSVKEIQTLGDSNVKNSKSISLSSLQQIKPPSRPVVKNHVLINQNESSGEKRKSSETARNEDKTRATSPGKQGVSTKKLPQIKPGYSLEKSKKQEAASAMKVQNNSKRGFSPDKSNDKVKPEKENEQETNSVKVDVTDLNDQQGADDKTPQNKQSTTTRLPPAGKNNSLVGNGDISRHRLPPANNNKSLVGKPNGDVTHNNNMKNNDRRQEKHVSSIHKPDVMTSQSNRIQTRGKNSDTERMSVGSRNSNRVHATSDRNKVSSPRTDTTEYRIQNPRSSQRVNGQPMSPKTEMSTNSRTSSESRGRSKEFTFRWNAPSRNTSPEATDKSSSPPLKQYKPSAQIQSFYSYLYGRSKKRKSVLEPSPKQKPKEILKKNTNDTLERERPQSFVLLRSKTVKRSAWDTEPAELTYKPSTNGPEEISQAYVGEESIREAEMTAKLHQMEQGQTKPKENNKVVQKRSKIPPWYEKEYVLNRRQAGVYRNMSNAYGNESKKHREQRFVQRLAEYEVYKAKQQWEELLEKDRRKRETKERQILQLNELRQRFEDEAYHRFHTQYVTSRVLEHEKMNRDEYGLPEDNEEDQEQRTIIKRKKVVPKSLITEDMIQDIYKKKFNKIFDVNKGKGLGRRPKTPKMEGIDTVVLEETDKKGNTKERKRMVKEVIKAAEKQLEVNKKEQRKLSTVAKKEESHTPSMKDLDLDDDSDDDDMDDIFEKARRKYDLDVDD